MFSVQRDQPWPIGVNKGPTNLMQTNCGNIVMLGHVIGDYFYTPDIGKDKWEIWSLSDLMPIKKQASKIQHK